jgi:hypothetical protein
LHHAKKSILAEFNSGLKELNAQYWLLLALCAHGKTVAADGRLLDGLPYQKSLAVLFRGAGVHLKGIRLRDESMSSDLRNLCSRAEAWLPAYFLVLGRSLAEGALYALFDVASKSVPTQRSNFKAFRRARKSINSKKGLELLAGAAARGDFDAVNEFVSIAPYEAELRALSLQLQQYSRTRNSLAHRLGQQLTAGTGVGQDMLRDCFRTLDLLVSRIAGLF